MRGPIGSMETALVRGVPRHWWLGGLALIAVAILSLAIAAQASGSYIQQATLSAGDEVGHSGLGSAVGLSANGNIALVGGPDDNGGTGAAWVFVRKGSTWAEQAKLTGEGEIGRGEFGTSVALSSDGKTALIGGSNDDGGIGAAWVFVGRGSNWVRQEKLTGKDVGGGQEEAHCDVDENGLENGIFLHTYCFVGRAGAFGASVALSSNGHTALVGSPGDNEKDGAAWVFTRTHARWVQQGEKLTGAGETNFDERYSPAHIGGEFGTGVALSADGSTALVGGPQNDTEIHEDSLVSLGAAWVFTRSGSTWTQLGEKFTGSGGYSPEGKHFGDSVAVSASGATALVGGPKADWSEEQDGAAWAFTRSETTFIQQGKRLKNDEPVNGGWDEELGVSAALSSDGNTALVGNQRDDFSKEEVDSAIPFTRSASNSPWTQIGKLKCGTGGCHVALSGDASTALAGTTVYVDPPTHR